MKTTTETLDEIDTEDAGVVEALIAMFKRSYGLY